MQWWKRFFESCWESRLFRPKWKQEQRNFQTGDIVLIKFENVVSDTWQLGRVTETHPDKYNITRDVTVASRRGRRKKDSSKEYKARPLEYRRLPVQRLALLLGVEEQQDLPPAEDLSLHVCHEDLRVPLHLPQEEDKSGPLAPGAPPLSPRSQAPVLQPPTDCEFPEQSLSGNDTALIDYADPVSVSNHFRASHYSEHGTDYTCWQCGVRRELY